MLRRTTLAIAAVLLAGPAIADETCLPDARGAQCDVFLEQYRNDEVPVGTTNVWASEKALVEEHQGPSAESGVEFPTGDDVIYWDGESAMVVPEETGPRVKVADW